MLIKTLQAHSNMNTDEAIRSEIDRLRLEGMNWEGIAGTLNMDRRELFRWRNDNNYMSREREVDPLNQEM